MKITCFADSHGKWEEINFPKKGGDVLIFCGDISTENGSLEDVQLFSDFMSKQKYLIKIFVSGNHDFPFENELKMESEKILKMNDIIYLNDSGHTFKHIKFWGSPVTPFFHDHAFNRKDGYEIKLHWDKIPIDTDILVTHSPPHGLLDKVASEENIGSTELKESLFFLSPKYHLFGHAHESYGCMEYLGTRFVNCSLKTNGNELNEPFSFEI